MKQPPPFQSIVEALLDTSKPFPTKYLTYFSDMDPASLELALEAWPRVALTRKRTLLADLDSLLSTDTIVSFDDFARALLNDPDAAVRAGAIRLLAECEDIKLLPVYASLLASDPDATVRAEAANILNLYVELGELEEIPEKALRQAEAALLAAIHDEDAAVRRRVIESLGYSSRDEVPDLINAACERGDPEWIASALIAMGRSQDDERWSGPVVRMLLSEHHNVRLQAVRAAGELELADARQPLLLLLDEEADETIFTAAVWSLSQIGGEDVRVYLENLLDQTDDDDTLEFIEDALANLSFTEDIGNFGIFAFDGRELDDAEDIDEQEETPSRTKKK
ncbi:MAG: hypothetical protein HFACDABA_02207 [Anaerolineales bacterium]|nr:hypothetical protein [Anaerolineales bacterium]